MNSTESVANWCAVDTKTGKITVMLEENYCFDAEVYADELDLSDELVFRDDQRSKCSLSELSQDVLTFSSQSILENGYCAIYLLHCWMKRSHAMKPTEVH